MSERVYRILLALLIAAGWFFGLAPFLAPTQFAQATGFTGADLFVYRVAGAATFAYGVGLLIGWRASWAEMRTPFIATFVFNLSSIFACFLAIAAGKTQWIVYVILLASILFTAGTGYFIRWPPAEATAGGGPANLAQWVLALFVIGTLAALFFGVASLGPAGAFGKAVGATGADDFIYRQAGAATLGAGVGGIFVLLLQALGVRAPANHHVTGLQRPQRHCRAHPDRERRDADLGGHRAGRWAGHGRLSPGPQAQRSVGLSRR